MTSLYQTNEWVIKVPPGDKVQLKWILSYVSDVKFTVYDGHADDGQVLTKVTHNDDDIQRTAQGDVQSTQFTLFVRFTKRQIDTTSYVNLTYRSIGKYMCQKLGSQVACLSYCIL